MQRSHIKALGEEKHRSCDDPCRGGFLRDGLSAVLAEFGAVSLVGVWVWSGARHAVEAVGLVDAASRASRAGEAHVRDRMAQGDQDALKTPPRGGPPGEYVIASRRRNAADVLALHYPQSQVIEAVSPSP